MINRKSNLKTILIVILALLTFSLMIFSDAYSYFTSTVQFYTVTDNNGDTYRAKLGMQLSLLFDKVQQSMTEGTSLKIEYRVKLTDGTNTYYSGLNGSNALSNGTYTDSDGNSVAVQNGIYTATNSDGTVYTCAYDSTDKKVYYTYNHSCSWGTPSNPYLISDKKHLQNLSVLQNIGYFENLIVSDNWTKDNNIVYTANSESYSEVSSMPFFLVCEPDGTPATIDCGTITFTPIGNDTYPFIGYVGGSFVDSTTTVNGNTSDQSAIYSITVQTTEDQVDLGLFGSVGYLGNDNSGETEIFTGIASTIKNLLLYDVKVVVDESKWKTPNSWVASLYDHMFSFQSESDDNQAKIYHENHHIGILAGHVEYASINDISIYYSSDDIAAIDLRHTSSSTTGSKANYLSISGILGYVFNMNCTSGNNEIQKNGTQNADIEVSGGGVGTGGGIESGTGRGYVYAKDIYNIYDDSGNIITYTNNGYIQEGLLVIASGTYGGSNTYSLQDGTTITIDNGVAVVTSSYQGFIFSRTAEDEFPNFFVRYGSSGNYTYYYQNSGNAISQSQITMSGTYLRFSANYTDGTYNKLCVQFVRNRILFGTQNTNRYYFYDGVFTFALSDASDKIMSTWKNANGQADTITLGNNNASDWETDVDEGNHSVVAYIKQVTSESQLQQAIDSNKQVFLMYKQSDGTSFIVTLAGNSEYISGSGDDAVRTYGTVLGYLDDDSEESLKNAINSGSVDMTTIDGTIGGMTKDQLIANWNSYELLNVGAESATVSLADLKSKYSINSTYRQNTSSATYYDESGNVINTSGWTWSTGSQIAESGLTASYSGYFYYTINTDLGVWRNYNVYYVNGSGSSTKLESKCDYSTVKNYFKTSTSTQYDFNLFTNKVNGTNKTGPFVYKHNTNDKYFIMNSPVEYIHNGTSSVPEISAPNNGTVTWNYTAEYDYFIGTITSSGTTYKFLGTTIVSEPIQQFSGSGSNAQPQKMTVYGKQYNVYSAGGKTGILLLTYEIGGYYSFSSIYSGTKYSLRILERNYYLNKNYSLICSSDSYASTASTFTYSGITPSVSNSTDAALSFNSDGSCLISYTISGKTRYLEYVSSNQNLYFHGTDSNTGSACKMYIYTIEGMQDVSYGHITFEPKDGKTNISLSCDEYVLYPNSTSDLSGGATSTADPTYTVKRIEQGGSQHLAQNDSVLYFNQGWKSGEGKYLTNDALHMSFVLSDGISSINLANLFNGDTGLDSSEYVRAPIGTDGKESYIPLGCLAFRVNASGSEQKVRVIVSVPQTDCYYGEVGGNGQIINPLDYTNDYYFCMWQVEAAGEQTITSISLENCMTAFELPRSNTYRPGNNAGSEQSNYVTVIYQGNTYRTYLNGNRVLVAYEFSVSEEGVYVLGSNKGCEIVYFSADSTASEGRDGESSYKMGTIDYVYENSGRIVTVLNSDPVKDNAEDYQYYYPSLALFYTYNAGEPSTKDTDTYTVSAGYTYANINDFTFYVRRVINPSLGNHQVQINWKILSGSKSGEDYFDAYYLRFTRYSLNADVLNQSANALRN